MTIFVALIVHAGGWGGNTEAMIDNGACVQNGSNTFFAVVIFCRFLRNLIWPHLGFAFTALILLSGTGCAGSDAGFAGQQRAGTAVRLSPGDVIRLAFAGAADLNQTQKIKADGKVNLPLIGEVTASGKTLPDFQSELVRLYKSQLRNSEVVVTLESGVAQVVVSGSVQKPGKMEFDRPTTVFQAIMEAGGINEFGNLKKVRLIRTINGAEQSQVLDLTPALKGATTQAFYVKDGDVIFVPQTVF
jgi:polysaccharide biosynthesis/export protein